MKTTRVNTHRGLEYRVYPFKKPDDAISAKFRSDYVYVRCTDGYGSNRASCEIGAASGAAPVTVWGAEQMGIAWTTAAEIARRYEMFQEPEIQVDEIWEREQA